MDKAKDERKKSDCKAWLMRNAQIAEAETFSEVAFVTASKARRTGLSNGASSVGASLRSLYLILYLMGRYFLGAFARVRARVNFCLGNLRILVQKDRVRLRPISDLRLRIRARHIPDKRKQLKSYDANGVAFTRH